MIESIGTLNEQPLHAALKDAYSDGGGRQEVLVDGYIVDVLRGQQLIEIQTQHFYAIKDKLFELINRHTIQLVYPIASQKWLLKLPKQAGGPILRRKSPKRGCLQEVFGELVSFPELIAHPNFSLDVVLAEVEELRRYTGEKPWRQNGWVTVEQRLIRIVEVKTLERSEDLLALFPETLPGQFTTADLEIAADIPRWLAQRAAYCLNRAGAVEQVGKRGRFNLYKRTG